MMKARVSKLILIVLSVLFIFPLSAATAEGSGSQHAIIIDPAHGGADKGVTLSKNVHEKAITLAIAKEIKSYFSKTKKIKIYLTRSTDKDLSISERTRSATRLQADLFISLNINAGFGKGASGYEVYFPGFEKAASSKGNSKEKIVSDMVRNEYLNDSVRFAHIVMKNIEKIFPRKNRGLRYAPIPILEGLTIPAVVIELGFATNLQDRKKLVNKKIQKSIAAAIGKSIKEYIETSGEKS
jgi:N-acetylmuramoyl-L-alanine amidase